MPVDRGGLGNAAALFQLIAEGVEVLQDGGIGLSALKLGKSLLEVVEQPRGIGTHGRSGRSASE